MELRIVSVNVGKPRLLGTVDGEAVSSGIVKTAVAGDKVFVGATNIEGDRQADLRVHGGIDKAVYLYPSDHWSWWQSERNFPCGPAAFGENLTTMGGDETEVAIGDRFRWGSALLEISQPRAPCFKFALLSKREDAPQIMTLSGRCGWYFRVIEEGEAPVAGASLVRDAARGAVSVRDAFLAATQPRTPKELIERVVELKELSEAWRKSVARRLA